MPFRLQRLTPLLVAAFLLTAVLAAPVVARASTPDTLTWARTYAGPENLPPVGEGDWTPVAGGFSAVSFSDAAHGWGVGVKASPAGSARKPFVAFTADGGATWAEQSLLGTITAEINGVYAGSEQGVWVACNSGTLATFNGISWTKRTVPSWPSTKAFRAVTFADATHGWAVGDGLGIARTVDGGDTWTIVTVPGTGAALNAIAAVDAENAIAVGNSGTMRLISAGGAYAKSSGTSKNLRGITFADSTHAWAVGDSGTFVTSTNAGVTWYSRAMSPPQGHTLLDLKVASVAFADSLNGVAVATYQTVWRTTDGGQSWRAEGFDDGGEAGGELRGVAFVPGSSVTPVAVGGAYQFQLTGSEHKARAFRGSWIRPPDTTAPTTNADALSAYLESATIHLTATDDLGGSGVAHTYYRLDAGAQTEGVVIDVRAEGAHSVEFWSVDAVGNEETPHNNTDFSVTLPDTTPPVTGSDAQAAYLGSATIRLNPADDPAGSGVAHTYYRLDGGEQVEGTTISESNAGDHDLEFWSVDVAGNIESPHVTVGFSVTIPDTTAPTSVSDVRTAYPDSATIQLSATDNAGGSGVAHTYYRVDDGPQTEGTMIELSTPGAHGLEFWSVDVAGNEELPHKTAGFSIQVTPPPDTTAPVTTSDTRATYTAPALVKLSATDAGGSGVAHTYYRLDGAAQAEGTSILVSAAGSHSLEFWSVDVAANVESHKSASFTVVIPDTTAPTTVSDAESMYLASATIHLSATDDRTGAIHTYYRLDGGVQAEGRTVNTDGAGTHLLEFWSVDAAGNIETPRKTAAFLLVMPPPVDIVGPTTVSDALASYTSYPTITLTAADNPGGSGVAATYYTLDGGPQTPGTAIAVSGAGSHSIGFWSVDLAGNVETPHKTANFTVALPYATVGTPRAPSSARHGRSFTVYGYLKPQHASGTSAITLNCYRYQSGHYVWRKSVKVKVSNYKSYSKYSGKFSLKYTGKWRILAKHSDSDHKSSSSGFDYVRIY